MKTHLLRENDCSNSPKIKLSDYDISDTPSWNHKTVLIVDGQIDVLITIKSMLQTCGYAVNAFNDPLLALEHFTRHSHDYGIVISDMIMPSMSGLEFIRQIRSMNPDTASFVITALDNIMDNNKEMLYEATLRVPFDGIKNRRLKLKNDNNNKQRDPSSHKDNNNNNSIHATVSLS